eukprot:GILJ01014459.1.p1 GENE.GILJ01014459.1~~GILJ01014459.1.p1  ORF type:complete len:240 (-),score=29.37 GILJ01014459.1:205-924(-)
MITEAVDTLRALLPSNILQQMHAIQLPAPSSSKRQRRSTSFEVVRREESVEVEVLNSTMIAATETIEYSITTNDTEMVHKEDVAPVASSAQLSSLSYSCEEGLAVPFGGIGHFGQRVVYVGTGEPPNDSLLRFAAVVRSHFLQLAPHLCYVSGNAKGFTPHLTILKFKYQHKRRKNQVTKVDTSVIEALQQDAERVYGLQVFRELELSSMIAKPDERGFYASVFNLPLVTEPNNLNNVQ